MQYFYNLRPTPPCFSTGVPSSRVTILVHVPKLCFSNKYSDVPAHPHECKIRRGPHFKRVASCRPNAKDVVNSTYSPLFSTGAPSNITVASCRPYAKNHDNSFHACAFIICLNHPIYASTIVLFSLDNKKEFFFFEEIVVIYLHMCIFCCKFAAAK